MADVTAWDAQIMARTLYGEARGCSMEEKLAVAWSIVNRFHASRWFSGLRLAETCLMYEQYSCWNPRLNGRDNKDRTELIRAADHDPAFLECAAAVQAVVYQQAPDPTKGATHYVDHTIAPPAWAKGAELTLKTEHFSFYRNVA